MPKFIRYCLLILAVLLPVQNALIGLAVNRLGLPEWLSLWKEVLTLLILGYFLWQIWQKVHQKKYRFEIKNKWSLAVITLITIIALVSSFWVNRVEVSEFVIGFRFELWWLWFFAVTMTWWKTVGSDLIQNPKSKIQNDELKSTSNSPLLREASPSGDRGFEARTNFEHVELADTIIPPNSQQTTLSASSPGNPETNVPIPPNPLERGGSVLNSAENSELQNVATNPDGQNHRQNQPNGDVDQNLSKRWRSGIAPTQEIDKNPSLPTLHFHLKLAFYLGFGLVAIIALAQVVFGQPTVAALWTSETDSANSFVNSGPSCHVVDYQVDGCRLSGPFSTPNHFVGYLLLILPIFLINFLRQAKWPKIFWTKLSYYELAAILLITLFTILSFSRYAWLGLAVFAGFLLTLLATQWLPKQSWVSQIAKIDFFTILLIPLFIATIAVNLTEQTLRNLDLPQALVKPSSTSWHARHTNASLEVINQNPDKLWFGWGLPSSGPAAKEMFVPLENNEMLVENRDIAAQYRLRPINLAIPENWFLQLVLNGGVVYFLLYSLLVLLPIFRLLKAVWTFDVRNLQLYSLISPLGFFAIILGNLLLHIWENQTIALYWTLTWLYLVILDSEQTKLQESSLKF